MKGERLGEFEELALLAVLALTDGAYGVAVQELIERETGREVTLGAVYAALERMERKGLLRSDLSESTGERGGKRRRQFRVTPSGLRTLGETRRAREALWKTVPPAIRSRT
jgi:PadR family transcriptional regulator PadR